MIAILPLGFRGYSGPGGGGCRWQLVKGGLCTRIETRTYTDRFEEPYDDVLDKDIPEVAELFTHYSERFTMAPIMTPEEMRHQFLSGLGEGQPPKDWQGKREKQVVWAYVVEVYSSSCVLRTGLPVNDIAGPTDPQDY